MKKNIRFYIALWLSKCAYYMIKVFGRKGTNFPGVLAQRICPDFLKRSDRPKTSIMVTGTNGKTTVCNLINDILTQNEYSVMNNKLGSNMQPGIIACFVNNTTFMGKIKKDIAVLELDERSARIVFPNFTPDYLVCTNIFRDSLKRNANTDYIADIISQSVPKETLLILNADDPIAVNIAPDNKRIYFGISKQDTDTVSCDNIVKDIVLCPRCASKLEYDYYKYHHIGKMHCTNCDFATPSADYLVTRIDKEAMKFDVVSENSTETYSIISDNMINVYNLLSAICVLKQIGLNHDKINSAIGKMHIVESRFVEDEANGIPIIMQLAKGQNPIACSLAFDYVRKDPIDKAVILILDDLHEKNEVITWMYDCDYEFLNREEIKQIIISGKRALDTYVRLLIAGVGKDRMQYEFDEVKAASHLNAKGIKKVYILYDLYSLKQRDAVCEEVKKVLNEGKTN